MTRTVRIPRRVIRIAKLAAHNETYQHALKPGPGYDPRFVPGVGSPMAKLVIIGEAPGEREAELQEPFVGRSGALLDEALAYAGLEREDIYITNLVKYRPPNNDNPGPEVPAAMTLLQMELNIIKPLIAVPMGRFASLLWWQEPAMGMLVGQRFTMQGQCVMPMYHPAYVLRNGSVLKQQWFANMRKIRETLDKLMRVEEKFVSDKHPNQDNDKGINQGSTRNTGKSGGGSSKGSGANERKGGHDGGTKGGNKR